MSRETLLTSPIAGGGEAGAVDLLDELLDLPAEVPYRGDGDSEAEGIHGAVVGEVVGRNGMGCPVVRISDPDLTVAVSRSTVDAGPLEAGTQVVLLFERGDPQRPILVGAVQPIAVGDALPDKAVPGMELPVLPVSAIVDDERIVLQAEKEIVLQCGKASITLTRAGKILLRGAYLLSRSSGVNRIKGGSVQIN